MCLFFVFFFSAGYTQTLVVKMFNGTENSRPINTIRHLTFPAGNLLLTFSDGSTEPYALADVRSVVFVSAPLSNEMPVTSENEVIKVYPNPAGNSLQVDGITTENIQLRVYSVYGALLMQTDNFPAVGTIDISHLKPGMYFIEINNHISKFFKI